MNDVRTEVQHRQVENASPFDNETLVDQVWRDMSKTVPLPLVAQTVAELVSNYDDAAIKRPTQASVRREAGELLRFARLTEVEAN